MMMNSKTELDKIKQIKEWLVQPVKEAMKEVVSTFPQAKLTLLDLEVSSIYPSELALKITEGQLLAISDLKATVNSKVTLLTSVNEVKAILGSLLETKDSDDLDDYELSVFNELAYRFTSSLIKSATKNHSQHSECTPFNTIIINQDKVGFSPFESRLVYIHLKLKHHTAFDLRMFVEYSALVALMEKQEVKVVEDIKLKEVRLPKFVDNNHQLQDQSSVNNLDLILNVPLKVSIEIGQAKKKIKEIMSMTTGYVIELDKQIGAPVDIVVNGQHLAKGEVVVIDENFAIRITEIVNVANLVTKD